MLEVEDKARKVKILMTITIASKIRLWCRKLSEELPYCISYTAVDIPLPAPRRDDYILYDIRIVYRSRLAITKKFSNKHLSLYIK